MAAQGIYVIKIIDDENVFDNLCETLEQYNVKIISPGMLDFEMVKESETELILSAPEEVLEELKEELEANEILEIANIVDSFENPFDDDMGEEMYDESAI